MKTQMMTHVHISFTQHYINFMVQEHVSFTHNSNNLMMQVHIGYKTCTYRFYTALH